jgi:hypothetical protein
MKNNLNEALLKALVSTGAGTGGDFIPQELATTFIGYVTAKNFCRQLFRTEKMFRTTKDIPKILSGTNVYYRSTEGSAAVSTSFKTATLRLTAKMLMARLDLSKEVIEDAILDMENLAKGHFVTKMASAEEEAMIIGNASHAAITATESAADANTWFNKSSKLIFNGLLTLSGDSDGVLEDGTRAASRLNCGGGDLDSDLASQAQVRLGKYGQIQDDLVFMINPWQSHKLRQDRRLTTIDKYGTGATIVTGEVGKLWGKISCINTPYMTDGYAVMTNKNNPMIGDRRQVQLDATPWAPENIVIYTISERIDFNVEHLDAVVQLHNLDTATAFS